MRDMRESGHGDADDEADDGPRGASALVRMIRGCGLRPGSVLDVGCGSGGVLRALRRELQDGVVFDGWDVAAEPIALARRHEDARLRFHVGDPVQAGVRADLVLLIDVVEHVPDDVAFLGAARALGDTFLVRVPIEESVWDALHPRRAVERRLQYGHLHRYNRELALEVLDEAGYAVISEDYDRVPPVIERPAGRAMDAVRRAAFRLGRHRAVEWFGGYSLLVCARPV